MLKKFTNKKGFTLMEMQKVIRYMEKKNWRWLRKEN